MYKIYQVEYGDTINSIANKTNTTKENIKNINGFIDDSELMVGSLIIVPKKENEIFETYIVNKGDSIYSISRAYNINPEMLILINGLNKDDYIYPGQKLMIPQDGLNIYVTKQGDTLESVARNFGVDFNVLGKENNRIFLVEDQLLTHKNN